MALLPRSLLSRRPLLTALGRLGWDNVARVAFYRAQLKSGWFERTLPVGKWPTTTDARWFFERDARPPPVPESLLLFGSFAYPIEDAPAWSTNYLNGVSVEGRGAHWSRTSDFGEALGDIKCVWEPSRFDWALRFGWRIRNGERQLLGTLEHWLRNWCEENQPNAGANWKCGQEASIRVMHLLFLVDLLEGHAAVNDVAIAGFVHTHLERVLPSLHYATGQSNNHATSEAVALYCGGVYLKRVSAGDATLTRQAERFEKRGRRALERNVAALIMSDGTFAQYSPVYHRLMLDTLVFAELQRRRHGGAAFSERLYRRMAAASRWLADMVDPVSGDVPNVGSNDGAHLFNAAGLPYRDFKSGLSVAWRTFVGDQPGAEGARHAFAAIYAKELSEAAQPVSMTDNPADNESPATGSQLEGGFAMLSRPQGRALLRLPGYRFRPAQCDANHLDVWHKGVNVLRDAGTYSYNTDAERQAFYPGVNAHNTVQFDDRQQMPNLSRFLYAHWTERQHFEVERASDGGGVLTSTMTDYRGNTHTRRVESSATGWIVTDKLEGPFAQATLRWRLAPLEWQAHEDGAKASLCRVRIDGSEGRCSMAVATESTHYLQESNVPVLEYRLTGQGTVVTHLEMY